MSGPARAPRTRTGIPGFDLVAQGGLPTNRTTLVAGTPGTGKTTFAAQFLAEGIRAGETGVFVTFEMPPEMIKQELASVGLDVATWEREGKWVFVDASEAARSELLVVGGFDLSALLARIRHAVAQAGAKRVALDAIDALSVRLEDPATIRNETMRIVDALARLEVTTVMTAERTFEDGPVTWSDVEGFVVASVVLLRNRASGGRRRRTLEILKVRGGAHDSGEHHFTILPGKGIVVVPRTRDPDVPEPTASTERVTMGAPDLDELVAGGPFRASVILAAGDSGTGKTTLALEFAAGGARAGERVLFINFESTTSGLFRSATSIGQDFEAFERDGRLRIASVYPESRAIDDHLVAIKEEVEAFRPDRVVVDGLPAMDRIADASTFRDFVVDLTAFLRATGATAFLTTNGAVPDAVDDAPHVSAVSDVILLLGFVEEGGAIHHALTVLKMRGSLHDASVRRFWIDGSGFHVGEPFRHATGILSPRMAAILAPQPPASAPPRAP